MNGYRVIYDGSIATVEGKDKDEGDIQPTIIQIGEISTTPSKIEIPFVITSDTKIKNIKCTYKLSTGTDYLNTNVVVDDNKSQDQKQSVGTCTIDKLLENQTYSYKIEVKNEINISTETGTAQTVLMQVPSATYKNNDATDWKTSKVLVLNGQAAGATLQYKVITREDGSEHDSGWVDVSDGDEITLDKLATTDKATNVYIKLSDGTITKSAEVVTQTHIDTTAPDDTAPSGVPDTESITVTSNQADDESGVTAVEYGISTEQNGTYNYQASNVFSGLTKGNDYYIKTRVNNNARVNSGTTTKVESQPRKVSTREFTAPTITVDNTDWAASHTFTANYTKGEITNAYYYIRSTVDSKLITNTTLKTCTSLSGTTKDCTGNNVTQNGTLSANTWYQVSVTSVQVKLEDNGSVYVAVSDGHNLLDTPIATTSRVDDIPPVVASNGSVSTTTSTATVPITVTDNEIGTISSVTCEYKKNTDTDYVTTNTTGTTSGCTFTKLLTGQTYNYRIKATDTVGNTTTTENALKNNFTTTDINNPTTALDITENPSTCSQSKTITVKGAIAGTQLQYRIGSGEWTDIANNGTFTLTQNATVYARLYDGHNETTSTNYKTFTVSTYDVTPVGTTAPSTSNVTENSVTVSSNQTDNCGLNTSTLQYGYSTSSSSGYTWVNNSTITGLNDDTTYYIKTRVNDTANNGLTESSYATIKTEAAGPKNASEITYTNNGQSTVDGALDDLFSKIN